MSSRRAFTLVELLVVIFDAVAAEHNIAPYLVSFATVGRERPGAWFGNSRAHTGNPNDGVRYYEVSRWRGAKLAYITDGRSNTVLIGEQAGAPHRYAGPRPVRRVSLTYEDSLTLFLGAEEDGQAMWPAINRENMYQMFAFHSGGAYAAFCDGSTRFLSEDISEMTLRKLLTRDDGQPIDWTSL